MAGAAVPSDTVNGWTRVLGRYGRGMQPASRAAAVEDLDDLAVAVARLEATADALDDRLAPAPRGSAAGRA